MNILFIDHCAGLPWYGTAYRPYERTRDDVMDGIEPRAGQAPSRESANPRVCRGALRGPTRTS